MSQQKKESPAPVVDVAAIAAQIRAEDKRAAEDEAIARNPSIEPEGRVVVHVDARPVPLKNIVRATEHARAVDLVQIPEGAKLWKDSAVFIPRGFLKVVTDGDLFRRAFPDEIPNLVTANVACVFCGLDEQAKGSVRVLNGTKAEAERRAALVEKAKKALAEAELHAQDGERMVAIAERDADDKAAALATWIAGCGHPEEAVRAAAARMMSPEPIAPPARAYRATFQGAEPIEAAS